MADAHADISKHVKQYIGVFVALAVFTVLTVWAAYGVHVSTASHIAIAMVIATIKASLVAAIFMHLKWEKAISIWWLLGLCACFFVFLMLLPVVTVNDLPPQAEFGMWTPLDVPVETAVGHGSGH